jgi:hypothetical protein
MLDHGIFTFLLSDGSLSKWVFYVPRKRVADSEATHRFPTKKAFTTALLSCNRQLALVDHQLLVEEFAGANVDESHVRNSIRLMRFDDFVRQSVRDTVHLLWAASRRHEGPCAAQVRVRFSAAEWHPANYGSVL